MADKLKLVYYGNETLKTVSKEIKNITQETIDLVDKMYKIMYKNKGIGLAAPQVDIAERLLIIDIAEYGGPNIVLINPKITEFSDRTEPYEEGCLSLPGLAADIVRPSEILISGVSTEGKDVTLEASGLFARVLQHEIDHLDGKVFIDHLEDYIRNEFRPQLKKIKKLNKK